MLIFKVVLIAFILGLTSYSHAETVPAETKIKELEEKWSNLYGRSDLDGIMTLMSENSVLIMPEAAPILGLDDIRNATQAMLESDDKVSWESNFASVSSSGDMAYDYGTSTTERADGSVVKGYYLVVWIKENGEWKVAADMFN